MNKPHKHAELIKQWAEGAEIECYYKTRKEWHAVNEPAWWGDFEFRVKPKVKWTPKYTLFASDYTYVNSSYSNYKDVSDDVKNYWKLTKFVEEFETDWDNQSYEVFEGSDNSYTFLSFVCRPSLGTIRMSKQCAEKLCDMLNAGGIEL